MVRWGEVGTWMRAEGGRNERTWAGLGCQGPG